MNVVYEEAELVTMSDEGLKRINLAFGLRN
jgi:hypothetical protein